MDITDTNNKHQVFVRLVGRVMGALDLAKADDNVKRAIKSHIWQAERDLYAAEQKNVVDRISKNMQK